MGKNEDKVSPLAIGQYIYDFAKKNNVDAIRIKNVPWIGIEIAVLNLNILKDARRA